MMMEKKKGKKNRFVGSWNAASAFPQLFRNLFFLALMVGEKRVLTCKHARQGRTVFIPLVS